MSRLPVSWPIFLQRCAVACAAFSLAACGTLSGKGASESHSGEAGTTSRGGGYYLDDGPGKDIPANLDAIPDAMPRVERLHRGTSRPYTIMGRSYTPMTALSPYRARGVATWYGRRYHGQRTSSGEVYDMYAMTAAHTTLPIPSYVRVTNVSNGRSVIVRVNDRGPFIGGRLIDLSYVAAHKLDLLRKGSGLVEVETILPGDDSSSMARAQPGPTPAPTETLAAEPAVPASAGETVAAASPAPSMVPGPVISAAMPAVAASSPEHYLQLGAFSMQENAQSFMERVRSRLGDLDVGLTMQPSNNLYRIHSGPYSSRDDALLAADRIGRLIGATPILATPQ